MMSSRLTVLLIAAAAFTPGVSVAPDDSSVSLLNGTEQQHLRMMEAVERFEALGLRLPPLAVTFHDDEAFCSGHLGLFRDGEILICSDLDFIYEHELAHAWERENLDESTRRSFMELRGHDNWFDMTREWNERGGEDAAFIIQQGLLDQPLPFHLNLEALQRLEAFELLTGMPSPRLSR